jgi:hypothetical protein
LENKEIARILWETADLMEIAAEDSFRIRSYRNGATAVEGYPERIVDILRDPARKVTDIPGIGKGLAHVRAARSIAADVPAFLPRIPEDPGTGSQEHRAHLPALPYYHHR